MHQDDWQITLSYDTDQMTDAQVDAILESLEPVDGAGSFSVDSETTGSASVTITMNDPHASVALKRAIDTVSVALYDAGIRAKTLEYIEVCRYEED